VTVVNPLKSAGTFRDVKGQVFIASAVVSAMAGYDFLDEI
jgi:hypothetical protein